MLESRDIMATMQERRAYKEVLIILEKLDLIQEIPENVIHTLRSEQDNEWNFEYDETLALEEQNILRDTAVLFSNLYLAFICKDKNEKEALKNMYDENQEHYDNNLINSLSQKLDNQKNQKLNNLQENNSLLNNEKKSFFKKILMFFKKIFH